MDLAGWVPQPGGAKSDRVPSADEVFIERVLKVFDDHIMFSCRFVDWSTGEAVTRAIFYDFPVLDDKTRPRSLSGIRLCQGGFEWLAGLVFRYGSQCSNPVGS